MQNLLKCLCLFSYLFLCLQTFSLNEIEEQYNSASSFKNRSDIDGDGHFELENDSDDQSAPTLNFLSLSLHYYSLDSICLFIRLKHLVAIDLKFLISNNYQSIFSKKIHQPPKI